MHYSRDVAVVDMSNGGVAVASERLAVNAIVGNLSSLCRVTVTPLPLMGVKSRKTQLANSSGGNREGRNLLQSQH